MPKRGSTTTRIRGIIGALASMLSACAGDSESQRLMSSKYCYTQISTRNIPRVSSIKARTQVPLLENAPAGSRVLGRFPIKADFATILTTLQSTRTEWERMRWSLKNSPGGTSKRGTNQAESLQYLLVGGGEARLLVQRSNRRPRPELAVMSW